MGQYTVVTDPPQGPFTFRLTTPPNNIVFYCDNEEVLQVSDKGFWVRGAKVEQDDKEAENVYNAFTRWLTWQHLTKE